MDFGINLKEIKTEIEYYLGESNEHHQAWMNHGNIEDKDEIDPEKLFNCYLCEYKSIHKKKLRQHMIKHTELSKEPKNMEFGINLEEIKTEIEYYLGESSEHHQAWMNHGNIEDKDEIDPEKLFNCYLCEYKSIHKKKLRQHMIKHTELSKEPKNMEFGINLEEIKTEIEYYLGESSEHHQAWMNHGNIEDKDEIDPEKLFNCYLCEYKSIHKKNLRQHMIKHTGVKPFHCPRCSYATNYNSDLRRHMLGHGGEKPYSCRFPYCRYNTNRLSDLRAHKMVHSGDKPYSCSLCSFTTCRTGNLKVHMMIHTGEKPYVCVYCDFATNQAGHLKTHLMIHTGEKPYSCARCDYSGISSSAIKRHMKCHDRVKKRKRNEFAQYLRVFETSHRQALENGLAD